MSKVKMFTFDLLKAMVLTVAHLFKFIWIPLLIVAVFSPTIITAIVFNTDVAFWVFLSEIIFLILSLMSMLKFGKWEREYSTGREYFAGWDFKK